VRTVDTAGEELWLAPRFGQFPDGEVDASRIQQGIFVGGGRAKVEVAAGGGSAPESGLGQAGLVAGLLKVAAAGAVGKLAVGFVIDFSSTLNRIAIVLKVLVESNGILQKRC
jgi:hypothetical protein